LSKKRGEKIVKNCGEKNVVNFLALVGGSTIVLFACLGVYVALDALDTWDTQRQRNLRRSWHRS